jgi:hypothetical protein
MLLLAVEVAAAAAAVEVAMPPWSMSMMICGWDGAIEEMSG